MNPTPRPGSRTFLATTGPFEHWKISRVDLTLDDVIDEELTDYRVGLERGGDPASEDDRCIWQETEGGTRHHLAAIVRPRTEGGPLVIFPDEWPEDAPETDRERQVWEIVKRFGADRVFEKLLGLDAREVEPPPSPPALTDEQRSALFNLEKLGRREFFDRLFLAGAYGLIASTIDRLGTDAVGELRKLARQAEGQ